MIKNYKVNGQVRAAIKEYRKQSQIERDAKKLKDAAKDLLNDAFGSFFDDAKSGDILQLSSGMNALMNIACVSKSRVNISAMRLAEPELIEKFTENAIEFHFKPIN